MIDLTLADLCQALANRTHQRCFLVNHSLTCRCALAADTMATSTYFSQGEHRLTTFRLASPTALNSTPEMMFSEIVLIFFVVAVWLSAIGFCLNQYKSLRRLETQVHYCISRKDPLNIGEIKIVTREQDSIIYKKKRYSTVLDTHIHREQLEAMHYVHQYLPKSIPSALSAFVYSRDNLTANIVAVPRTKYFSSTTSFSVSQHHLLTEDRSRCTTAKENRSFAHRTGQ